MAVTTKPMTLKEFLTLPEEKPALEFVDGVVTQKVSPKARHSRLQRVFIERANQPNLGAGAVEAFPELRARFAGAVVVPDVAVYREDRIPYDSDGVLVNDITEPPDIAIEIVSPDQSVTSLIRRCLWYITNGVVIALLVDPDDVSILSFRPGAEPRVLRGPDRIDLSPVVPAFQLTVNELFASLRRQGSRPSS